MRVLSIDVGIKNLAYCLLEKNDPDGHFSIKCWDIANLSSPSQLKCCIKEKNKDCMQQAKIKNNFHNLFPLLVSFNDCAIEDSSLFRTVRFFKPKLSDQAFNSSSLKKRISDSFLS